MDDEADKPWPVAFSSAPSHMNAVPLSATKRHASDELHDSAGDSASSMGGGLPTAALIAAEKLDREKAEEEGGYKTEEEEEEDENQREQYHVNARQPDKKRQKLGASFPVRVPTQLGHAIHSCLLHFSSSSARTDPNTEHHHGSTASTSSSSRPHSRILRRHVAQTKNKVRKVVVCDHFMRQLMGSSLTAQLRK